MRLVLFLLFLSPLVLAKSERPLEGRRLRCCALIERPTLFESALAPNTNNLDGLAVDYVQQLQNDLGFQCDPLQIYNATSERYSGFSGFVDALNSCTDDFGNIQNRSECQCDIGVGCWLQNERRVGMVDFIPAFVIDDFRILVRTESLKTSNENNSFFIMAFNWDVWLAILGLIVMFAFLKVFDRQFAPSSRECPRDLRKSEQLRFMLLKSPFFYRIRKAFQSILSRIVLSQSADGIDGDSHTMRQWTINFFIFLCGLILVLTYEASMTASLVVERKISKFRSVEDLASCRVMARDVCIPGGGAIEDFWNSSIANSSCQQVEQSNTATIVESYIDGIQKLRDGICDFFLLSGGSAEDYANGPFCGVLQTTGKPFFTSGGSFVLPPSSNLTLAFSRSTLSLKKRGSLRTFEKYFNDIGLCVVENPTSISFPRLRTFFITAYSAGAVMFFIMNVNPRDHNTHLSFEDVSTERSVDEEYSRGSNSASREKEVSGSEVSRAGDIV